MAAASAAIWMLGKNAAKGSTASTIYSLVSSDLDTSFMNCHDLDHKEGCYTVCGDNQTNDYLNRFVFKPLLGKTYCVNSGDYALYEMKSDGSPGEVLLYDESKHEDIVKLIKRL